MGEVLSHGIAHHAETDEADGLRLSLHFVKMFVNDALAPGYLSMDLTQCSISLDLPT